MEIQGSKALTKRKWAVQSLQNSQLERKVHGLKRDKTNDLKTRRLKKDCSWSMLHANEIEEFEFKKNLFFSFHAFTGDYIDRLLNCKVIYKP